MQGDDAVERVSPEFTLQEGDLGLLGMIPELAVEIASPSREARSVLITCGIADGIKEEAITLSDVRIPLESANELNDC